MEHLPYYPYSEYLKNKYGEKTYKLPVNLPVGCPNREEGNGCDFCAPSGTGFESLDQHVSITDQLKYAKEKVSRRYHASAYIAYFQNYTNTYLPLETFKKYIMEAIMAEPVKEIAISTRPDCIRNDYLDFLLDVYKEYHIEITIELGLQTTNYKTLNQIHRGHSLAEFLDAVLMIRSYPFDICTHIILNLPGDTMEDVVEMAKVLSALRIHVVKVHSLYITHNTRFSEMYQSSELTICSKDEYLERAITFLQYLSPEIAVERLFGRVPEKDSVFCNWGISWWKLRDELIQKMNERNLHQGDNFDYLNGSALKKFDNVL